MNHKFKIFITIAVVSSILILSATAFILTTGEGHWLDDLNLKFPSNPTYNYRQGATIAPGQYFDPVFNDITQDYRPKYEGLPKHKYEWYFGDLPPFPEDFFYIAQLIFDGRLTDYDRVPMDYFLQPEFYPGWFSTFPNSSYIKPEDWIGYWTPEGYGCYPTIKEVNTSVRGETVFVTTFFKAGYDVNAYQGLILRPYLPDYAVGLLGGILFEQSDAQKKFLSVNIANPDDELYLSFKDSIAYDNVRESDWMLILEPTHMWITDEYDVIIKETGFNENWVKVVELEITIDENAPAGDYVIAFDIVTPCHEINQEYYFAQDHDYYGISYNPGGHVFRSKRPHFQCILQLN